MVITEDILIIATMFHFYKHSLNFRKASAIFLLLIFLFSVTPKRFLHTLFANHIDRSFNTRLYSEKSSEHFSNSGINCQLDNLVVESSFLFSFSDINIHIYPEFISLTIEKENRLVYSYINHTSLRGPPFSC